MGALFAVAGTLSVGQLSCFLTYANQYTKPFNEVTGVLTQLQTGIAAAGRVFEVLEADNEIPDNSTKELEHCKGNVKIENVNFSYTKKKSRSSQTFRLMSRAAVTLPLSVRQVAARQHSSIFL